MLQSRNFNAVTFSLPNFLENAIVINVFFFIFFACFAQTIAKLIINRHKKIKTKTKQKLSNVDVSGCQKKKISIFIFFFTFFLRRARHAYLPTRLSNVHIKHQVLYTQKYHYRNSIKMFTYLMKSSQTIWKLLKSV